MGYLIVSLGALVVDILILGLFFLIYKTFLKRIPFIKTMIAVFYLSFLIVIPNHEKLVLNKEITDYDGGFLFKPRINYQTSDPIILTSIMKEDNRVQSIDFIKELHADGYRLSYGDGACISKIDFDKITGRYLSDDRLLRQGDLCLNKEKITSKEAHKYEIKPYGKFEERSKIYFFIPFFNLETEYLSGIANKDRVSNNLVIDKNSSVVNYKFTKFGIGSIRRKGIGEGSIKSTTREIIGKFLENIKNKKS